jgi:N6-adenosine-specific RNA methylase IME4
MSLVATPKPLSSLTTKYGCIIADPPWPEVGGGKIKRGADRHYPVMKVSEIAALPVNQIIGEHAHLYLWITNNYLARGAHLEVAGAWGFRPVTVLTWRKLGRIGLGQYFRGTTEHVIFCVRGAPPYKIADGKRAQGITDFEETEPGWCGSPDAPKTDGLYFEEARPGAHSRKPTKIHEWAELVSHGPYLELFARSSRERWDAWGNEAPETLEDVING